MQIDDHDRLRVFIQSDAYFIKKPGMVDKVKTKWPNTHVYKLERLLGPRKGNGSRGVPSEQT